MERSIKEIIYYSASILTNGFGFADNPQFNSSHERVTNIIDILKYEIGKISEICEQNKKINQNE
jgi:hypothetical protein